MNQTLKPNQCPICYTEANMGNHITIIKTDQGISELHTCSDCWRQIKIITSFMPKDIQNQMLDDMVKEKREKYEQSKHNSTIKN